MANKPWMVVSFYTINTPYEKEVEGLQESCEALNIDYYTEGLASTGSWIRNTQMKPGFILEMFDKYPDYNIVWLDADARVRQYPKLFDNISDEMALHYLRDIELLSGTMFFKNTAKVRDLLRYWERKQINEPSLNDQKVLEIVVATYGKKLKLRLNKLPPTYCQIFDTMAGPKPVIEHMQASRRYRDSVTQTNKPSIPYIIGTTRIRRIGRDSFAIAKSNAAVEAYLDELCYRIPNKLQWKIKAEISTTLEDLTTIFQGQIVNIVGKGPSLDHLLEVGPGPTIAINEAIHIVERLDLESPAFVMQQDDRLEDTCLPRSSGIMASHRSAHWYAGVKNLYLVDPSQFNLTQFAISAEVAIATARFVGAVGFRLYCFDGCVTGDTAYAECVGYPSTVGGKPSRFLNHRAVLTRRASPLPIEWIIPNERSPLDTGHTAERGSR